MAMGDRGTDGGGRSRGHAHIYIYFNDKWIQQGPDGKTASHYLPVVLTLLSCLIHETFVRYFLSVEGKENGDQFGFAVAMSGDGSRFARGPLQRICEY